MFSDETKVPSKARAFDNCQSRRFTQWPGKCRQSVDEESLIAYTDYTDYTDYTTWQAARKPKPDYTQTLTNTAPLEKDEDVHPASSGGKKQRERECKVKRLLIPTLQ
ncbi:hypothetical protein TrVGV298_010145 [Trichoderma virens]|nr:hypothetical protein TrVGV298_010145 [Trichoderma virens]